MKRKFIYQSETSSKYWNISIEDQVQIVNFGKLGTKGRETIKDFGTNENCLNQSNKLIQKKLKKGYTEILTKEEIALSSKAVQDKTGMNLFWEIISKANRSKSTHWKDYNLNDHIDNICIALSYLDKDKITLFEKVFQEKMYELHISSIAELYFILNCSFEKREGRIVFDEYLSTDGFIYFRCWLLLKGKGFFDDIKKDINAFINGSYSFDIGHTWAEGFLYVADKAYSYYHKDSSAATIQNAVQTLYPNVIHYDSISEHSFDRAILGNSALQEQYPELVNSMCALRS